MSTLAPSLHPPPAAGQRNSSAPSNGMSARARCSPTGRTAVHAQVVLVRDHLVRKVDDDDGDGGDEQHAGAHPERQRRQRGPEDEHHEEEQRVRLVGGRVDLTKDAHHHGGDGEQERQRKHAVDGRQRLPAVDEEHDGHDDHLPGSAHARERGARGR